MFLHCTVRPVRLAAPHVGGCEDPILLLVVGTATTPLHQNSGEAGVQWNRFLRCLRFHLADILADVEPQLNSSAATSSGAQVYQNSSSCWPCAKTFRYARSMLAGKVKVCAS
jgi:hypothetical protein